MKNKIIFSKLKLKQQIILLVGSAIGTLLIFLATYIVVLNINNRGAQINYVKSSVNQLIAELDSFDTDLKKIIKTLAYNRTVEEFSMSEDMGLRYILSQNINLIVESIQISNPRIDGLAFTDLNQVIIGIQNIEFFRLIYDLRNEIDKDGLTDDMNYYRTDSGKIVCLSKSFYNYKTGVQHYIISIYNMDNIESLVEKMQAMGKNAIIVLDQKQNILFSNQDSREEKSIDSFPKGGHSINRTSKSGYWSVVGNAYPSANSREVQTSINVMIMIVFIISGVLCLTGCLIYKGIASPIESIIRFMNNYGKYYNKQRLPIIGTNEIAQISISVNEMLDNLQKMTRKIVNTQERLYIAELLKRQAELTALQIQMNPHFLYNTLDCIKGIALVRKVSEIAEIANSMSKILKYSIKSEDVVLVKQEISSIKDYLKIIQIRHQNRFEINVNVEDSINDFQIPKMILQPVVENAIFYGLERSSGTGILWIEGRKDGKALRFIVENTGESISNEKVEELTRSFEDNKNADRGALFSEKSSIGLMNIDKRIKLLYGENFGISINGRKKGGTKVTVTVPGARTENNR